MATKAIDELRAAATTENIQNKVAVPLADAERIVTEQEQRIGELEAQLAALTVQHAELTAIVVGVETERDEYRAALLDMKPYISEESK